MALLIRQESDLEFYISYVEEGKETFEKLFTIYYTLRCVCKSLRNFFGGGGML